MNFQRFFRFGKKRNDEMFNAEEFIVEMNANNVQESPTQYIKSIIELFQQTMYAPGDIVELGVATGRNSYILGHLIKRLAPNKRYIGFDTFTGYTEIDIDTAPNPEALKRNQDSGRWNYSEQLVRDFLRSSGLEDTCNIVVGDLKSTFPHYLADEPHRRISMLYVDCNAYLPSLMSMRLGWPFMTSGSVICIDEHSVGGETKAIKEFAEECGLALIETGDQVGVPYYLKK